MEWPNVQYGWFLHTWLFNSLWPSDVKSASVNIKGSDDHLLPIWPVQSEAIKINVDYLSHGGKFQWNFHQNIYNIYI